MAIYTTRFSDLADVGLDDNWQQKPGSASVLKNWRWDPRGGWETVGGFAPVLDDVGGVPKFDGAEVIDSITWFSRHNGAQQYLVYETEGNLRFLVGSGTTGWETISTGRFYTDLPWQKTQFAANAGWLYAINGVDEPIRWNGREVVRCGYDQAPNRPQVWCKDNTEGMGGVTNLYTTVDGFGIGATGTRTDGDAESKFKYARSWVNDLGVESPISDVSQAAIWSLEEDRYHGHRYMVVLELGEGPPGTRAHRVYRSYNYANEPEDAGQVLYFLREIDHNIGDLWIDAIQSHAMGSQLDRSEFGPWPRGAKYISFFKSICFLAGMPEYPDRVVYSRAGQPENFPAKNFFVLGDLDSGEITAMRATKNALVVFKRRGIYLVKGDSQNGFHAYTLTEDTGTSCPNALADLPGIGLLFVSDDGVHLLEGAHEGGEQVTQVKPLSQAIQDLWRDVNVHALVNACGAFYHRDREYWLALPMWGSTKPNKVLVFHYETNSWSERPGIPVNCITECRDHRGYLVFGSAHSGTASASNHPGIHVWAQGWPDYDGATPTKVYESCWLNFRRLYDGVNVHHVYLYVIGYDGTITLDYYSDRRVGAERARIGESEDPRDQQDPSMDYTAWGEGDWDDGVTFTKWRPIVVRFDIENYDLACREFKFKATVTGRGQIIGYDVEIAQGGERVFKPINTLIGGTVS